jgi:hypothetical protein
VIPAALDRCLNSTFADVVTEINGILVAGSPYTPSREPYTPSVLSVLTSDPNVADICSVRIKISPDSNTTFDTYLPSPARLNRRFLTVGNDGFNGGTNRYDILSRAYP